jgi:deazaflavin-dependent oxidoreductase (nitroreductase family)
VLAVLRSRAHRLLSGMALELLYTGRRSGRAYALPVQYAADGDQVVVWPQAGERAVWWRNFREPASVTVRLAGRLRGGTAVAIGKGEPGWDDARRLYGTRWRRAAARMTGPLVVILLVGEVGNKD